MATVLPSSSGCSSIHMLDRPRAVYAKSKECGEHDSPVLLLLSAFDLRDVKFLEKPYSQMIGNAQPRTGFIDFLADLPSLDHHELFHHQTVYAKSKKCGEHDSPALPILLSA